PSRKRKQNSETARDVRRHLVHSQTTVMRTKAKDLEHLVNAIAAVAAPNAADLYQRSAPSCEPPLNTPFVTLPLSLFDPPRFRTQTRRIPPERNRRPPQGRARVFVLQKSKPYEPLKLFH